jgi:hypothetical protein
MSTSVAARPSWRWSVVVATALSLCFAVAQRFAVVPPDETVGLQPDAGAWPHPSASYGDFALFVRAGHAIWSGDLGNAYSDATVQTGPLALVWAAALAFALHVVHATSTLGFVLTAIAELTPTVYAVALWSSRHTPPRWLYVVAIASLVVLLVPWQLSDLIAYQHPTYLWVPALWLGAASLARDGRCALLGLTLAAACGLETWGVLAVPVLLLALPSWRSRARAGAIWFVATTAVWAPFYFSDSFRMLDMTWHNTIQTPIGALLGDPETITWQIRMVQALVIVGASIITWFIGRGVTDAATVAVAVVAWSRVITDAQTYPYYRLPLFATTVAILLAASAHYVRRRNRRALPALGISGAMISVAQAEVLQLPMLTGTALHVTVLTGLATFARAIPDSPSIATDRSPSHAAVLEPRE